MSVDGRVGVIVGEATTDTFYFASEVENYPPKWEYLAVHAKEVIDGVEKPVQVLAQVERIVSASQVLSKEIDFDAIKRILHAQVEDLRVWGQARILGYIHSDEQTGKSRILLPRRAVIPGRPIYIAPEPLLRDFYSSGEGDRLYVGRLINRPDVPVYISASGFKRHLAIIAQTGAGKSYCAGVLIEELLENGATLIVIDPHADYVFLSRIQTPEGSLRHPLADYMTVFRNPSSTGRYSESEIQNIQPFEVAFQDLDYYEICDIAGISEKFVRLQEAIRIAVEKLNSMKRRYTPQDLINELNNLSRSEDENIDSGVKRAAIAASRRIRLLLWLKIFGAATTPLSLLLKPMHLSIIDLSGLNDKTMDYVAYRILNDLYDLKTGRSEYVDLKDFRYPIYIFLEEAHKFIPEDGSTLTSEIINRIAAEGRKFGLFLTLITQRPSKVHPDTLSQCNSQIVMKLTNPEDQDAIRRSSERLSHQLVRDLPGLNVGEAVIVGEVTSTPVMVKVRQRKTLEGGSDIPVAELLREAKERHRLKTQLLPEGELSEEEARRLLGE
ncbi:MAG: ATP-binding protein [Candidatus Bathyarchaeia archaeon]|nr:ATP-binding protein [Candidatus Bathyarchaeota archaeon]